MGVTVIGGAGTSLSNQSLWPDASKIKTKIGFGTGPRGTTYTLTANEHGNPSNTDLGFGNHALTVSNTGGFRYITVSGSTETTAWTATPANIVTGYTESIGFSWLSNGNIAVAVGDATTEIRIRELDISDGTVVSGGISLDITSATSKAISTSEGLNSYIIDNNGNHLITRNVFTTAVNSSGTILNEATLGNIPVSPYHGIRNSGAGSSFIIYRHGHSTKHDFIASYDSESTTVIGLPNNAWFWEDESIVSGAFVGYPDGYVHNGYARLMAHTGDLADWVDTYIDSLANTAHT